MTASALPVSHVPVGSVEAKKSGRNACRMSPADQRTGKTEKPWTIQDGSMDRGRRRPETNWKTITAGSSAPEAAPGEGDRRPAASPNGV